MGTREVMVDTFSMGIDYQKFNSAAKTPSRKKI